MEEIRVQSESDLPMAAEKLLGRFPGSRVFAFYGGMGAGKTTFIKVLCSRLGVTDIVQSPTFALINQYVTNTGDPVFHFDFYRIKKPGEAFDIGYEEYVYSGHYCFIEWPELVEELLPEDAVKVTISGTAERIIAF